MTDNSSTDGHLPESKKKTLNAAGVLRIVARGIDRVPEQSCRAGQLNGTTIVANVVLGAVTFVG